MSESDHEHKSKERQAGLNLLRKRARYDHLAAQALNMDALARRVAGDAFVDENDDFSDLEGAS